MSPETLGTLGPIVVMVAIFYFLLYRPQKKQQSRRRAMLDSLKKGDQVITIGGIEVVRSSVNANVTQQEAA